VKLVAAILASLVVITTALTAEPDVAVARRKIIEAQCQTWAREQARAEYAPQIQDAARQRNDFIRSGNRSGAGLAGSTMALAQLAQQSRERELTEACIVDRQSREPQ
jgi:hypothetical protein